MLSDITKKCQEQDVALIYLSKFGSHLYGLDTENSDTDYKGLFLPSAEQLFLQNAPKAITYSTGENNSKNSNEDIDVQLWSLQYFLKLVSTGETNALDLLFSFTHPEMVIFKNPKMDFIFSNYNKLFNITNCRAFVGYAIGQAKKYGIKGSRLGVLKKVHKLIIDYPPNKKIDIVFDEIVEKYHDPSFCFVKEVNDIKCLVLCGKVHQSTIKIDEFIKRVSTEYKKYGKRAEEAEKNNGLDFKALSHAYRALLQMQMLINSGKIEYPFKGAEKEGIMNIKNGLETFNYIEMLIYSNIEDINNKMSDKALISLNNRDDNILKKAVLNFYRIA